MERSEGNAIRSDTLVAESEPSGGPGPRVRGVPHLEPLSLRAGGLLGGRPGRHAGLPEGHSPRKNWAAVWGGGGKGDPRNGESNPFHKLSTPLRNRGSLILRSAKQMGLSTSTCISGYV